jgi:DNA-binding response OmpR family regulator
MVDTLTSTQRRRKAPQSKPTVLLVFSAASDTTLKTALQQSGFDVITATGVKDALVLLALKPLDALVCELHLPAAGDGFTLVNAVRHFNPNAVTMVISAYPALKESLCTLLPQADEILVTPLPSTEIVTLLKRRLQAPRKHKVNTFEPAAAVLQRHARGTVAEWLVRVNANVALQQVRLTDRERTGHLPAILHDLVLRLRAPHVEEGNAKLSLAAVAHGKVRHQQGYVAEMLVEESRILQVCIFKTLRNNLSALDLALVLTDVMTIADEVDSQLRQTMAGFAEQDRPAMIMRA